MTTKQPMNFRINAKGAAPGRQDWDTEDPLQSEAALVRDHWDGGFIYGLERERNVTGKARE